ncbi:hypothetical protein [Nonomuraea sp. GTA35]|uniref:hypothetical protein n=1 Tax=Nonomuraea sp. GTA35 TaxID=1676746 RepID=UPI0035C121D3
MPDHSMGVLRDALTCIVPFHMAELHARRLTPQNLEAIASRAGKTFSHLGDALMFASKDSGRTLSSEAQAINALAEGIAAAELLQPGEGSRILDRIASVSEVSDA